MLCGLLRILVIMVRNVRLLVRGRSGYLSLAENLADRGTRAQPFYTRNVVQASRQFQLFFGQL